MVGEAGLEPTTTGLEGRCSIQLSYSPISAIVSLPGAAPKLQHFYFWCLTKQPIPQWLLLKKAALRYARLCRVEVKRLKPGEHS
jgi:hypothetical protein